MEVGTAATSITAAPVLNGTTTTPTPSSITPAAAATATANTAAPLGGE